MSTYILGVDVGTTSVKAVLLETGSRSVAASHTLPTTSDIFDHGGIKAKEQETSRIIDALNRCVSLLPRARLQRVCSIGVSGQMHGVLFWRATSGNCDLHAARCHVTTGGNCGATAVTACTRSLSCKETNSFFN